MADAKDANPNGAGEGKNMKPVQPELKQEAKKTTADEGKTFEADTVFLCVQDCWRNMTRYRRGDTLTGRTCPPYFVVKPEEEKKEKK